MERGAAAAVRRLRTPGGGERDSDRRPPPSRREDGEADLQRKKRGGPRRRLLGEGRGAPLVLLYLLVLRVLVQISHRQLLSPPAGRGEREFSAQRAR